MTVENERVARLEVKLATLEKKLEAEEKKTDILNSKINKAEYWGRGVMWAMIAFGGVMTQLNTIKEFVKRIVT